MNDLFVLMSESGSEIVMSNHMCTIGRYLHLACTKIWQENAFSLVRDNVTGSLIATGCEWPFAHTMVGSAKVTQGHLFEKGQWVIN